MKHTTPLTATLALFCMIAGTVHGQSLGSLVPGFMTGTGFTAVSEWDRTVTAIVVQPDNKILVGGGFNAYNGAARGRIARLNSDGTLDATFFPGSGFDTGTANRQVLSIALQPDGKVLAGGRFDSFNGSTRNGLVRLNANGSLDHTFGASGFSGFTYVYAIVVQPDGKVLLAGEFSSYQGHPCHNIIRVDAAGNFDPTFQPGTGTNDVIYTMRLQANGRILLGGAFTTFNGATVGCATRLLADGTLDPSFAIGTGFNGPVFSIATNSSDHSILLGGSFTQFQGMDHLYRMVKLSENGTYAFASPPQVDQVVKSVAFDWQDDIIIGGRFTSYLDGGFSASVGRIARLFAYGPVDLAFHSIPGFNEVMPFQGVQALAITAEGDVLAGGTFSHYNGTPTGGIAKLLNHCQLEGPCDDGDPNTVNDNYDEHCVCQGDQVIPGEVILEFQGDQHAPTETSFEILEQGTLEVACAGQFGSTSTGSHQCLLSTACYVLRVHDTGGDGILGGGYRLSTALGQRIIDNSGNFSSGNVSAIANNGAFCLPIGSDAVIHTSCDKLDWVTGAYIVAGPNPDVSAQYGTANVATSGYEFWFFDPNGGYTFRKFRSHMASDGFGPDNATRACHLKINNWAAANQIPANALMNVRVRGRVASVNNEWGPACRFKIDPVQAACPLTKLMDIPGNQYLSCGASRVWGKGNHVYARPVTGATQYQFRFRLDEEGFLAVRTSSSYFVQLNWSTNPLQNGKTYRVEVRAYKNGAWCVDNSNPTGGAPFVPWGDFCDLTIANTPMIGGERILQMDAYRPDTGLRMYPNPNRGDRLHLTLQLPAEFVGGTASNTVRLEIFDVTGKRSMTRTLPMNEGMIDTTLDLGGTLTNGSYIVHLSAGALHFTERLVIGY